METYFIYEDNDLHEPPAERGTVAVTPVGGGDMAYAGAAWGEHNLSNRSYCIVWEIRSSGELEAFLADYSYERVVGEEE